MKLNQPPMSYAFAAAAAMLLAGATMQASESDDRIESSFKKTYVYKVYLKDDAVRAESKDGVVTLTGTVAEESHKALAQDTAASLPGVTRVENRLATKADSATDNADVWLGRKVRITLLLHRNVSSAKSIVEVKDGVVTLRGQASSLAQKELTAEYAKDIDGVKEVKNEMTVQAAAEPAVRTVGEQIDDASVTSQVRTVLMTHRSTNSLKTKVEARNGEVTVTGIARNDAEKSLVTKLASDVEGVSSVKNLMTVEAVPGK